MADENQRPIQLIDEPGVRAEGALLQDLRHEVARLLGRQQLGFPGAQPVSFARRHLDELLKEDYFVCEKSDGIRYLLYMTKDGSDTEICYLIDRKNDYWWVNGGQVHFPTPKGPETFHVDTLLDGELVMDTLPDGTKEPKYLVFDCIVLDGQNFMSRELSKRLGYFDKEIHKPYKDLYVAYPSEKPFRAFEVVMKSMQVSYGIEMVFRDIIQHLRHGNDGLIFTCLKSPYQPGTDQHILKWKSPEENTIDFKWRLRFPPAADEQGEFVDYDAKPHAELLVNHGSNKYQPWGELYLEDAEWEELKALGDPLDERIVEAYMDEQKRWRFYRFRDDKTDGNHVSVVDSVSQSIRDAISKDELIAASKSIRDAWKKRAGSA